MGSKKIYDYTSDLKDLTEKMKALKLPSGDVYTLKELIPFKSAFSHVNGMITHMTTVKFAEMLITAFNIDDKDALLEDVMTTSPYANGFDLKYPKGKESSDFKVIAEIKCNVPVKGEKGFGAAQVDGIDEDMRYLSNTKKKKSEKKNDYTDYLRFMVIMDPDGNGSLKSAVTKLLDTWNDPSADIKVMEEGEVRLEAILVENMADVKEYSTDKIYVVIVPA